MFLLSNVPAHVSPSFSLNASNGLLLMICLLTSFFLLLLSVVDVVLGFAFAFLLWSCTYIFFLLGRGCGFRESGWQPEFKSPKVDLLDDGFEKQGGSCQCGCTG
jgi:hypothetical protein